MINKRLNVHNKFAQRAFRFDKKSVFGLLACGLLLTACNTDPKVPTDADPPMTTLTGKMTAGSGEGTVQLKMGMTNVAATGTVDTSGNLKVTLPTAAQVTPYLVAGQDVLQNVGCTGTLTLNDPTVKATGFLNLHASRGGKTYEVFNSNASVQILPRPSGNFVFYVYVYANKSAALTGIVDCAKVINQPATISKVEVRANVQLRTGWNVLKIDGTTTNYTMPFEAQAGLTAVSPEESVGTWLTSEELAARFKL